MLTKNLNFNNFHFKRSNSKQIKKIQNIYKKFLEEKNLITKSLCKNYKDTYKKNLVNKFKKEKSINIIGMGGSILGSKAIYNFLSPNSKKFNFIDNLITKKSINLIDKKNLNIIISKSGNTLETISNSNIIINTKKNIFITEDRSSYLMRLAKKLKAEVVHHNNFIGGRYSVLSEVGMLPAQLMGFKPKKFRRFNELIKNKRFVNLLINDVFTLFQFIKKKSNLVILNYDESATDLFYWYQQLIAESLGKKRQGIFPIISSMPKDNHSLMQYYLDGPRNNFFTFFFPKEKSWPKIKNKELFETHFYLKNKDLNDISYSQFISTQRIFRKKNIPFRSFLINKRNEETLGEIFTFFILETILLGKLMRIDPFNQPAVELIKTDTKKNLIKS